MIHRTAILASLSLMLLAPAAAIDVNSSGSLQYYGDGDLDFEVGANGGTDFQESTLSGIGGISECSNSEIVLGNGDCGQNLMDAGAGLTAQNLPGGLGLGLDYNNLNDLEFGGNIVSGAVDTGEIASSAVTSNEISSGAVDTGEIASSAVTSNEISDGTITTTDFNTGNIDDTYLRRDGGNYMTGNLDMNFNSINKAFTVDVDNQWAQETSYTSTGSHTYDVSGKDYIKVELWGAQGGDGGTDESGSGGASGNKGDYIEAVIDVRDRSSVSISVGTDGGDGASGSSDSSGGAGQSIGGEDGSSGERIDGDTSCGTPVYAGGGGGGGGLTHIQGLVEASGGSGGKGGDGEYYTQGAFSCNIFPSTADGGSGGSGGGSTGALDSSEVDIVETQSNVRSGNGKVEISTISQVGSVDIEGGGNLEGSNIVNTDNINTGAVSSSEIQDGSVTTTDFNTGDVDDTYLRRDGSNYMTGDLSFEESPQGTATTVTTDGTLDVSNTDRLYVEVYGAVGGAGGDSTSDEGQSANTAGYMEVLIDVSDRNQLSYIVGDTGSDGGDGDSSAGGSGGSGASSQIADGQDGDSGEFTTGCSSGHGAGGGGGGGGPTAILNFVEASGGDGTSGASASYSCFEDGSFNTGSASGGSGGSGGGSNEIMNENKVAELSSDSTASHSAGGQITYIKNPSIKGIEGTWSVDAQNIQPDSAGQSEIDETDLDCLGDYC